MVARGESGPAPGLGVCSAASMPFMSTACTAGYRRRKRWNPWPVQAASRRRIAHHGRLKVRTRKAGPRRFGRTCWVERCSCTRAFGSHVHSQRLARCASPEQVRRRTLGDVFARCATTSHVDLTFERRRRRHFPVLPKPPAPRSLTAKSSTTLNFACTTGTITSCASRSSGFNVKGSRPRFQVDTISSPW